MASFTAFPSWKWDVPEFFNIGAACTDAHLGTPVEGRVAMIVEDDALGTSSITYGGLTQRTSRFAQLLRDLGVKAADRVLVRLPNSIDYPSEFARYPRAPSRPIHSNRWYVPFLFRQSLTVQPSACNTCISAHDHSSREDAQTRVSAMPTAISRKRRPRRCCPRTPCRR